MKFKTIRKGTRLFHGTNMTGFSMPLGPAFFTRSRKSAKQWVDWRGIRPPSDGRILSFVVKKAVRVANVFKMADWDAACSEAGADPHAFPVGTAKAFRRKRIEGWITWREVMLSNPARFLETPTVRVPLGRP